MKKIDRGGYEVAFLGFGKKKEVKLDESLDIPPVPPPGLEEKEVPEAKVSEEEFPPEFEKFSEVKNPIPTKKIEDLPPLPDIEGEISVPTLPPSLDIKSEEEGFKIPLPIEEGMDLPPLPEIKEEIPKAPVFNKKVPKAKKKFKLPFMRAKKKAVVNKGLELPPLPMIEEELPEFPAMPGEVVSIKPEAEPILPFEEEIKIEEPKPEDFMAAPVQTERVDRRIGEVSKPLFIVIDRFKEIVVDIKDTKTDLKEFGELLAVLGEERYEEKLYSKLRGGLIDVQKKLQFIDKSLFKG